MIWPWERKELTICTTLSQCESVRAALEQAGIPHQVKARDRSSPSPLSMGTRERSGTFGQNPLSSWSYTIYVRRRDWEQAMSCIR